MIRRNRRAGESGRDPEQERENTHTFLEIASEGKNEFRREAVKVIAEIMERGDETELEYLANALRIRTSVPTQLVHDIVSRLLRYENPKIRVNALLAAINHLGADGRTYYHDIITASRRKSKESTSQDVKRRENYFRHSFVETLFTIGERSTSFLSETVENEHNQPIREEAAEHLKKAGIRFRMKRIEAAEGLVFGIEHSNPSLSGLCAQGITDIARKAHEQREEKIIELLKTQIIPELESRIKEIRQLGPVKGTDHELPMVVINNAINAINGESSGKQRF